MYSYFFSQNKSYGQTQYQRGKRIYFSQREGEKNNYFLRKSPYLSINLNLSYLFWKIFVKYKWNKILQHLRIYIFNFLTNDSLSFIRDTKMMETKGQFRKGHIYIFKVCKPITTEVWKVLGQYHGLVSMTPQGRKSIVLPAQIEADCLEEVDLEVWRRCYKIKEGRE